MSLRDIVDDDDDGGCCPGSMTAEEFKVWLRQFDTDGDGRISRNELRRAMRVLRVRFTGRRARRGISYADADGDGYIDDSEIDGLVEFVRRTLGVRIVAC
jgi:calmodulin